jgi:hypothetical protein
VFSYLAPELQEWSKATQKSDVFSFGSSCSHFPELLGSLAYFIFTNTHPWSSLNDYSKVRHWLILTLNVRGQNKFSKANYPHCHIYPGFSKLLSLNVGQ